MTKRSTEIYTELQNLLATLRGFDAEAAACEPIRRDWKLSAAENDENFRRSARLDQIIVHIRNANEKALRLRKEYSETMAAEQVARPTETPVSAEMSALLAKRLGYAEQLIELQAERVANALAAAGGDKKAQAALDRVAEKEDRAWRGIQELDIAKLILDGKESEERAEFLERAADEKHSAGLAAAEPIIEWAAEFDRRCNELAEHYAKLRPLQNALAKSGAEINTDLTNRIYTAASRDRAAVAAGLHRIFSIDATVQPAPLGDAFKSLLKAAVRRPAPKSNAA